MIGNLEQNVSKNWGHKVSKTENGPQKNEEIIRFGMCGSLKTPAQD